MTLCLSINSHSTEHEVFSWESFLDFGNQSFVCLAKCGTASAHHWSQFWKRESLMAPFYSKEPILGWTVQDPTLPLLSGWLLPCHWLLRDLSPISSGPRQCSNHHQIFTSNLPSYIPSDPNLYWKLQKVANMAICIAKQPTTTLSIQCKNLDWLLFSPCNKNNLAGNISATRLKGWQEKRCE